MPYQLAERNTVTIINPQTGEAVWEADGKKVTGYIPNYELLDLGLTQYIFSLTETHPDDVWAEGSEHS